MPVSPWWSKPGVRRLVWRVLSWGPRRRVYIETENGHFAVSNKDWLIGKILFVRRAYEMSQIHAVCRWLRRNEYLSGSGTVVDVGANIGMIGVALLRHGYCARALGFEPVPETFVLLRENVELNGLGERMQVFPKALSSAPGRLTMELSPDNSGDHRVRIAGGGEAISIERHGAARSRLKRIPWMPWWKR